MPTKPFILEAMQFGYMNVRDPINTSSDPRYTITYQYAGTSEPADIPGSGKGEVGYTAMTGAEKTAFEATLAHVETFLNVDFVKVTGAPDPDLNVAKITIPGTTTGYGGNAISFFGATDIADWDGFVQYDNTLNLALPAQENLLLHELGHALGLKHPFEDNGDGTGDPLPAAQENNKFTVMSYDANPDTGLYSDAMMLYDVFALQDIWGRASYRNGPNTYTGSRTDTIDTVWDTGGVDTFMAPGASPVRLDLRAGKFSKFGSTPDVVIAFGVKIENAKGGAGNDTLLGNNFTNLLVGNGGRDMLKGAGSRDILKGGAGNDTLLGQAGNDKLLGNGGGDKLRGGNGKDFLDGAAGNDVLTGHGGADRFVFRAGGDQDRITDFADNVDTLKFTGLGNKAAVMAAATNVSGDVVFDFGGGDILTVENISKAALSDDVLV